MRDASSLSDDLLSTAALRRVDEVCMRFEDVWRTGQRPRLEAFLAGACGSEREELLRELLRLERHYRQSLGEPLDGHEYERRFPEDIHLIRAVLAEGMTAAAGPAAVDGGEDTARAGALSTLPMPHGTARPAADSDAMGPEAATPQALSLIHI